MASTDKPDPEHGKETTPPPPKPETSVASQTEANCFRVDVALRVLLFASTVTAIVVLVTSKQTVRPPTPALVAKFNHSPAFM